MLYKIGKKFFAYLKDFLNFLRVFLVFLSFAVILFWLLQLWVPPFVERVAPFFNSIKDFTHLFYNRTVSIDEVVIDFSFLLDAIIFMIIVWALKFVVEQIEFVENQYESFYAKVKRKAEALFNVALEQEAVIAELKNNSFMVLINMQVENLMKSTMFNSDANVGLDEKRDEILSDFIELASENIKADKKIIEEGVLLYFNDFSDVDKNITQLDNVIKAIREKYYAQKWLITFYGALDSYSTPKDIMTKVKVLLRLQKLGLKNKIICIASFKQRYSLQKNPKYRITAEGYYKISEEMEEVYVLENKY